MIGAESSVVQGAWREHSVTNTHKAMNLCYSLVLDESTHLSSTSQPLLYICASPFHLVTAGTEQQPIMTFSWRCRKLCNAMTFSGISLNVLHRATSRAILFASVHLAHYNLWWCRFYEETFLSVNKCQDGTIFCYFFNVQSVYLLAFLLLADMRGIVPVKKLL